MRRLLFAVLLASVLVAAALIAVVTAVGTGARKAHPEPLAVAGQVAHGAQQFWAERGCIPLVPAALFDNEAATAPRAQPDCSDERARAPLARPYLAKHFFDPRTGELLVKTKDGSTARVSLGYERSLTGMLNYVRIEGLTPAAALRSLQECNSSDASPSAEFVGKCRSPFLGALDLRFVEAERVSSTKAPR